MAGTVRMKIEQALNGEGANGKQKAAQEMWKNLFDFLEAHPGCTRIALGYGSGGTGTDYHDGANPTGDLPFAVYRFDTNGGRSWPWYLFIGSGNAPGTSSNFNEWRPGGTNSIGSYGWLVVSAAVGVGGDENPWGGTTNNDGTDTIPSPTSDLWTTPSGGTNVKIIPASNSSNGSGSAEDNNEVIDLYGESSDDYVARAHFFADDDSIVLAVRDRPSLDWHVCYMGVIDVPNPSLSHPNPLVGFVVETWNSSAEDDIVDYEGGVLHSDDAEAAWEATEVGWQVSNFVTVEEYHPNQQSGERGSYALDIISRTTGHRGFMGAVTTLVRAIAVAPPGVTNNDRTKVVLGGYNFATLINFVLPWDGTTEPDTGTTRAGIDFVEGA